jgi:hypothetical protein
VKHRDQLLAVIGADALRGTEQVPIHGADRHGQPIGDLFVRESVCGKGYDFALTFGERLRHRGDA